ncbi:hypothetical protein BS47DRAFT_1393787 [Hydnum rufescens UP504]|uniref:BTB domain-containing protein n=1 Tax=Hydnum rufescens UP504 TaxID=1448309 RepID=A0A9P6DVP7_9AGAM|nr:hypothetical protein BS47DRAFT_1393787 [Hydnum rufescens UP504]
MSAPPPAGSATASSAAKSTGAWLNDLKGLFDHAKERFPDVVWEMLPEEAGSADEEVWGHKAMIYARAPPSFLAQYFDVRPNGASRIYSASPGQDLGPNPTQSTFSLAIVEQPTTSRTPSPSRAHLYSPSSSHPTNTLLRLTTAISPSLFSNQLEYIYTGKGIGAAFEFLFDSPEGIDGAVDVDATRIDKLRKDLVFMWRSRLYSDVKIALTGPFSPDSEEATAVFSSHRFILASRSSYFRALFLSGFASVTPTSSSGPITITLPSPPFTPASLHFTLGFIYAGTLNFSHRTFDLTTAFQIYRSAAYLSLTSLQSEIESRIVEEMTHGLFHAYLTFEEYEKVTGGRWGVGGSKCKQCTRRIPRILEFATSEDIKNTILDRGARRALVGLFGEGWVTPEFAALPPKSRATALKGVYARTTPQNLFPLLFAAESALAKVESPGIRDQPWADMLKDLIVQARKKMDDVLCSQCEDVFEQEEWLAILENDGVRFDDGDKVRWVMDSLRRGLGDTNAGIVYQTLVSSVLLRPHPTSASVHAATLLSSTSPIRSQVERARLDILRWLRKRWVGVRLANGFNSLDGWALKEISDELDVPVDDLLAPPPSKGGLTPQSSIESASSPRPNQDVDTASIASSQANAPPPNRSVAQTTVQNSAEAQRDPLASSRSSVASSVSVSSVRTAGTAQARARPSNPTSSPSVPRNPPPRTRVENTSPRPGNSSLTPPNGRPKSLAPSIASVRSVSSARSGTSTTSTLGKARVSLAPKTPIQPFRAIAPVTAAFAGVK